MSNQKSILIFFIIILKYTQKIFFMHNLKIKMRQRAIQIAEKLRRQDNTIATTCGSFDIIHPAHVRLLERARQYGDYFIVLLNSDGSVRRNKGPDRPIFSQSERAYVLASLKYVDAVTIFEEDTPLKLLEMIQPHYHIKGGSFIPERIRAEQELLEKWGGKFIALPEESSYSLTNIIERILDVYKG